MQYNYFYNALYIQVLQKLNWIQCFWKCFHRFFEMHSVFSSLIKLLLYLNVNYILNLQIKLAANRFYLLNMKKK